MYISTLLDCWHVTAIWNQLSWSLVILLVPLYRRQIDASDFNILFLETSRYMVNKKPVSVKLLLTYEAIFFTKRASNFPLDVEPHIKVRRGPEYLLQYGSFGGGLLHNLPFSLTQKVIVKLQTVISTSDTIAKASGYFSRFIALLPGHRPSLKYTKPLFLQGKNTHL